MLGAWETIGTCLPRDHKGGNAYRGVAEKSIRHLLHLHSYNRVSENRMN